MDAIGNKVEVFFDSNVLETYRYENRDTDSEVITIPIIDLVMHRNSSTE